ncbi:MAG: DUF177 domain-containing protein [Atopobiaceae bacterium]|nr:DUF177 domain-containing protein [Atopobiaceae bacterium]
MQSIIWKLDDRLAHPGDETSTQGHIEQESYSLGEHDFSLPQGIDYELMLTHAGEGILATGLIKAHVVSQCDRCLERAEFDITAEVDEYFLFELPDLTLAVSGSDADDESDYSLVSADETIDLSAPLNEALLMETPFVVLCSEDCKGLCPHCGANLNEGTCSCASRDEQKLQESPFSVLSDLKSQLDDQEN